MRPAGVLVVGPGSLSWLIAVGSVREAPGSNQMRIRLTAEIVGLPGCDEPSCVTLRGVEAPMR